MEQQLSETSQSIGFTVKLADSIKGLKELLRADTSDLVMAMIHKFREADLTETFPELNARPKVMTDEAHRSHYKLLAARGGRSRDRHNRSVGRAWWERARRINRRRDAHLAGHHSTRG